MVINLISNYKVLHTNGEDILILYLNFDYEFGGNSFNKKNLKDTIREYISSNRINFHGGIITFIVGGVLIGNVLFNDNEFKDYKPIDNCVSNMIVEKIEIDKKPVLEKKMDIDTLKKGGEKAEKKDVVKKAVITNNDANSKKTVNDKETNVEMKKIEEYTQNRNKV